MANKGGHHVNSLTDAARATLDVAVPAWVKFLQPVDAAYLRELRGRNPDVRVIFRQVWDGAPTSTIDQDTEATLRALDGAHAGVADIVVEVPRNEDDTGQTSPDRLKRYVEATITSLDRYARHGFTVAVGCFGVGWPRLEDVEILVPLLQEAAARGGYLATHEYWLPTDGLMPGQTNWSWWGLRYRRIWNMIRQVAPIPILVTECGIDGGLLGIDHKAQGWQNFQLTPSAYAAQIRAYLTQMADDPFVHGMTLYCLDATDEQWAGFRYVGQPEILSVLTQPMGGRALWLPSPDAEVPGPASLAGAEPNPAPIGGLPVPTIQGIDVSNNQGAIDWARVGVAGVRFAGMKASGDEGTGNVFLDGEFARNWAGAAAAGLVRIAYHYARPSAVAPAQSVTTLERALQAVGGLRAGDLVALDIEDPDVPDGTSLHVWVAEWLALAESVFGIAPAKYSARYYTQTHDLEHADLERFPTWWASWQGTKPAGVPGWTPIAIWQRSASGRVVGVAGDVDLDEFDGTVDELRALGLPTPPAPAPTPPPTPTPPADLAALTEQTYVLAHQIRELSGRWRDAGHAQAAEAIDAGGNVVERVAVIAGKGER